VKPRDLEASIGPRRRDVRSVAGEPVRERPTAAHRPSDCEIAYWSATNRRCNPARAERSKSL